MFDLSLQELLMRVFGALITVTTYGYAQSWASNRLEGKKFQVEEQKSFIPSAQISWLGLISYVLFLKGWDKPIVLNLERFSKRYHLVWVIIAGWLALFGLAFLALWLRPLFLNAFAGNLGVITVNFLTLLATGSIWFFLWSLIPLPPLNGFILLALLLPKIYRPITQYVIAWEVGLLLLASTGWLEWLLQPLHKGILRSLGGS